MTTWTGFTTSDDDCVAPNSSVLVERSGTRCIWQVTGTDEEEVDLWESIFLDEKSDSVLLDQNKQEHTENVMPIFCESNKFKSDNCSEWAKEDFTTADSIKINLCGGYSTWDDVPNECKCMRRDLNPAMLVLQEAQAYIGSPACVDKHCQGDDGNPYLIPSSFWSENVDCTGVICQNIVNEGDTSLTADELQSVTCGFGKGGAPPSIISTSSGTSSGSSSSGGGLSNVDLFAMVLDSQTYFLIVGFVAISVPIAGALVVGREGLISWPFLVVYGIVIGALVLLGVLRSRTSVFEDN